MRAARAGALGLAVALLAAGCDSGPSGPGTLSATVSSTSPLGAVVLEVVGPGVQGFEPQGSSRAFGATLSATEGRHRVVVVAPDGAPLRFGIRVEDLGADLPAITAVSAASPQNLPALAEGIEVRVER